MSSELGGPERLKDPQGAWLPSWQHSVGTQHQGRLQHSSLVLVVSGYGSGCPDMAQAVTLLQSLLPQAEQACSTHNCSAAPPLPAFSSATILPSSLACSTLGHIGGMIEGMIQGAANVASGQIQALGKHWAPSRGLPMWPAATSRRWARPRALQPHFLRASLTSMERAPW